jgi:hypothetical protein
MSNGEPWGNDIDKGKLLIRLWKSYLLYHLVAKLDALVKEIMNFCLTKYFFHTSKGTLTCRKILRHGADGFIFPPNEGMLLIFIVLKIPLP